MPDQTITSPDGEILRLIAKTKTTPHSDKSIKEITTDSMTIEVIISDSKMRYMGSQFGHVAIAFEDSVYSRGHNDYVILKKNEYLEAQQIRMNRDSVGLVLRVSPNEKYAIRKELDRRVSLNKSYNIATNSCSTNVADVLESIGILAHDPRGFQTPVTPAEILAVASKSKRVVKKEFYAASKP